MLVLISYIGVYLKHLNHCSIDLGLQLGTVCVFYVDCDIIPGTNSSRNCEVLVFDVFRSETVLSTPYSLITFSGFVFLITVVLSSIDSFQFRLSGSEVLRSFIYSQWKLFIVDRSFPKCTFRHKITSCGFGTFSEEFGSWTAFCLRIDWGIMELDRFYFAGVVLVILGFEEVPPWQLERAEVS